MSKTRTIEMPSDSQFAIALKTQQEAEREEQRRIKSHILNLDFQDTATDGNTDDISSSSSPFLHPNPNIVNLRERSRSRSTPGPLEQSTEAYTHSLKGYAGGTDRDRGQHHNSTLGRAQSSNAAKAADKSGLNRKGDRARKLKLSDVDWYVDLEQMKLVEIIRGVLMTPNV